MFETNTYVCFNTSRAVHLTRFGSLQGHFWPPDLLFDTPGPEKGGPSSPILAPWVRALDFQDQFTSGACSTSITPLLRSVQRLRTDEGSVRADRSEYQFNFNGRQALFIHSQYKLVYVWELVALFWQSPLQPPFKQAVVSDLTSVTCEGWRHCSPFAITRAPISPSSCFSCFYVFSVLTVRLRSSARLCVPQPLGRFHAGGGASAEAALPPGPLAQLHLPELDPGCWPSRRHGNKTMTSA